jgi:hypothetical protein
VPAKLRELGWSVEAHDDHFPQVIKDVDLLPAVAERGWVFLTQDENIRYRHAEMAALREAKLRAFVLITGNLSADETVLVLESARAGMERMSHDETPPFICRVAKNGKLRLIG